MNNIKPGWYIVRRNDNNNTIFAECIVDDKNVPNWCYDGIHCVTNIQFTILAGPLNIEELIGGKYA